jgi:hypothetical protein
VAKGLSYGALKLSYSELVSAIRSWSRLYMDFSYIGICVQLYEGMSLVNIYIYCVYSTIEQDQE